MATWEQFLGLVGTTINLGGTQCVAVANYYHVNVLGNDAYPPVMSAHQWYTQFDRYNLGNFYNRIPASQTQAQVGDIAVEYQNASNGEHGHICVVVRGWNGVNFETYDQNVNGIQRVFRMTKSGRETMGFLRPKNNPGYQEEVLTPEQARMLNEIYNAVRVGSSSLQARLGAMKTASQSVLATVSEVVRRGSQQYTQKQDRAMTQDFLVQILALLDEIDAGFEAVGYDNIAEPAQINYYESEAGPGESSVQEKVRLQLDSTKMIK